MTPPTWWRSPRVLVPLALLAAVALLVAFAQVVDGVVNRAPPASISPGPPTGP